MSYKEDNEKYKQNNDKQNCNNNNKQIDNYEKNLITLKFENIFTENIQITEAGKYELKLKKEITYNDLCILLSNLNKNTFLNYITTLYNKLYNSFISKLYIFFKKKIEQNIVYRENIYDNIDIFVNDFSAKQNYFVRKYIQQNCLFLSKNLSFTGEDLTLKNNQKLISLIYCGYDLSDASASSFCLKEKLQEKIKTFSNNEKNMIILSYCITCPAIIWIINKNLINNLSSEENNILDNAIKIRIKHGGVVIIINENNE